MTLDNNIENTGKTIPPITDAMQPNTRKGISGLFKLTRRDMETSCGDSIEISDVLSWRSIPTGSANGTEKEWWLLFSRDMRQLGEG